MTAHLCDTWTEDVTFRHDALAEQMDLRRWSCIHGRERIEGPPAGERGWSARPLAEAERAARREREVELAASVAARREREQATRRAAFLLKHGTKRCRIYGTRMPMPDPPPPGWQAVTLCSPQCRAAAKRQTNEKRYAPQPGINGLVIKRLAHLAVTAGAFERGKSDRQAMQEVGA